MISYFKNNRRSIFVILLPVGLVATYLVYDLQNKTKDQTSCQTLVHLKPNPEKQKGAHVFGILDTTDFQPLHNTNIEWITLVSWGFQEDYNSSRVGHHNGDSTNIKLHNAHWIKRIQQVKNAGFKVFFKPHLWIQKPTDGKWRSDIFPSNDKNWETWKNSYRDFILRYAEVAEKAQADMYCIGIEFTRLALEKPDYWESLIKEIRKVYSGKLVYAANWYEEFEKIEFWDQLDFIGIQAYFPLAKNQNPTVQQISKGWMRYIPTMEKLSKKHKRKIIFTEIGYRSTTNSASKPWEWIENSSSSDKIFSLETQANCYQAFFDIVWKRDWLAGVHFWQLRGDFTKNNEYTNLDFIPQGKPAETIMAKGFE